MKVGQFFAIGLTGGIASGKTLASAYLSHNYPVHDADLIVHELYRTNSELIEAIGVRFGSGIVENGQVRRDKLRELVFNNRDLLQELSGLVHPLVRIELLSLIDQCRAKRRRSIFVIPLLCENGWAKQLDGTLLISCEADVQLKRLMERDKCTLEEARKIISTQMSANERRQFCDWIIENNKSPEDLITALRLWEDHL